MTQLTTKPLITPLRAACLVAAPLVAVLARLVGTPWLEEPDEYLTEISRHAGASDLGAELALLSALLFIPAALTLAAIVGESRRRLAQVGGALTVVGAVGLAAVATASVIAGQMARVGERDAMVELWDRVLAEPPMQVFPLLLAAGAIGSIVLAVGLYRSRAVPRPAAVLVGLGGATTMLSSAGPVRVALVAAAVLALLGYGWTAAVTTRRATDSPRATTAATPVPAPG
jgi:hypothetical protein